jgi:alpha-galactosidase
MLILFWEGDRMRAHNRWRRLLLEHYTPRPGGAILKVPLCDANWGEMTADEQIAKIKWWKQHDLPMECYWIDAGWNGAKGEDCFTAANNRVPRKDLYPLGMKPVSDAAHQAGLKFLLWTWPHTARAGVEIGAKHPEWVLPGGGLDHGNPEVNRWMIDYYCGTVDEHGIDVFRQDGHSIYPADTAPDRLGMAQIRYTVGFYEFWDALLKSHPNLIIDNCAGGGRKIDFESIRRSVPLWRSDYQSGPTGLNDFDPNGIQAQTWALSYWVPLSSGACTTRSTVERVYAFRSAYSPGLTLAWHCYAREINSGEYDFELCRKLLKEYLSVRQYFSGDYYPLTPYSLEATVWMAWQFQRPGQTDGVVQAFRREKAADQEMRLRLKDLDSDAIYELKDLDKTGTERFSGRELMETGFPVRLPPNGSAVILYGKQWRAGKK